MKKTSNFMCDKIYFIDFDGTITGEDSLDLLFEQYAEKSWKSKDKQWEEEKIGSYENLTYAFSTFELDGRKLDTIVDKISFDKSFYNFIKYLDDKNHKWVIVSEGIDYIIRSVLEKNLPSESHASLLNKTEIISNKYADGCVEYPNASKECSKLQICKGCSVCKLAKVISYVAKEKIYIGDGYSDRHAISGCGKIYAKNKLEDYCIINDIEYNKFATFSDILINELA